MLTCLLMRRSFCIPVEGLLATIPAGEAGMVAIHVAVVLLQEVLDVVAVVHLRLCALAVGARPVLALLLLWLLCLLLLLLRRFLPLELPLLAQVVLPVGGGRQTGGTMPLGGLLLCPLHPGGTPVPPPLPDALQVEYSADPGCGDASRGRTVGHGCRSASESALAEVQAPRGSTWSGRELVLEDAILKKN